MKRSDFATLLALASLWGSSYLLMHLGAAEFGAVAFAGLRAGIAALVLLPLVAWRSNLAGLRTSWRPLVVIGLTQVALPFVLFSFAATHITTGLTAILGATTPLFGVMFSRLWGAERLDRSRLAGLLVGFSGVVWLTANNASFDPARATSGWAAAACLLAALLYGFSANYTKRHAAGVPPLVVAAGSQTASALMLALPAAWTWPAVMPGVRAWVALLAIGVACTAVAYVLFFRLIARVGATKTVTVGFLIPGFSVLWGALFLHEDFSPALAFGCAVILTGTALTTGALRLPSRVLPKAAAPSIAS